MTPSNFAEYRLLMFHPDPESGERICIGIAVEGKLLFDQHFSRVQCFSKKIGVSYIRTLVEDIRNSLERSRGAEPERLITGYAPMFQLSPPRKVATPVDESIREMLLRRFVLAGDAVMMHPSRGEARKQFSGRLVSYASEALGRMGGGYRLIENARSMDVLGEKRHGIRRVALALRRENQVVLLDGLDLNLLSSQDALRECTNVVRTFWQYKVALKPHGERIWRAAVIFNGMAPAGHGLRDIHAFVSAQFAKESDEKIEARSGADDFAQLAGFLK